MGERDGSLMVKVQFPCLHVALHHTAQRDSRVQTLTHNVKRAMARDRGEGE